MPDSYIICQIGAREHYQLAEESLKNRSFHTLITDYYAFSQFPGNFFKNLNNRRNQSLPDEKIIAFNKSLLSFELLNKAQQVYHWELHMKRNQWFQKKTINHIKKNLSDFNDVTVLFAYSYAAHDILQYAKNIGWKTTLGQIDPGPLEEEIVMEEVQRYPQYKSEWQPALKAYWDNWYRECELADTIQVNSEWSKTALIKKGIPEDKITIVPLKYTPPKEAESSERNFPKSFSKERPLRVLFLGQVILRKGIARMIEVAKQMLGQPIEFYLVGPIGIHPIPKLKNLKIIGRISRDQVHEYYKRCDVFLFPTLSDGYGLTQLEALSWKMPIIVSPFAGKVDSARCIIQIENAEVQTIQNTLMDLLNHPEILESMQSN